MTSSTHHSLKHNWQSIAVVVYMCSLVRCGPADKMTSSMEDLAAAVTQSQAQAGQQLEQQLDVLKDQVAAIGGSKADAREVAQQQKAAR